MFMIKKFYYLILCIRISNIDIATNQTTPKNSNKISKSLYLIYIYIYIYIGGGVYFRYKTSKTGIKTSKLYTTRYALSVRRATISLSPLYYLIIIRLGNHYLVHGYAHGGLTPQRLSMPVVQKNHSLTRRVIFGLLLKRVLSNFLETGLQHCKESDCQCSKNQTGLACFPVQAIQIHDG